MAKKSKFTSNLPIFIISLIYFIILFLNIDFLKVPNGDIYQYISDAKQYSNFRLPSLIQLQPLTPILIALLRPFFSNFEFPYFATAKFINILAASGSLIFTYLILKKYLNKKISLLIALLYAIHPLTLLTALDITTISLYVFFTTAAIYFFDHDEKKFFIMTTLAFLTRIEGLILFVVYIVSQFMHTVQEKRKKNIIKSLEGVQKNNFRNLLKRYRYPCYFFTFALILTILQTIHNFENNIPYGNQYLNELFSNSTLNAENFVYSFGLIGAFFFPKKFVWWGINLLDPGVLNGILIIISILFSLKIILSDKTRPAGLYLFWLGLVHSLFTTAMETRYFALFLNLFVSSVAITSEGMFKKLSSQVLKSILKLICVILIVIYLSSSINQIKNVFSNYREIGKDLHYDVSYWLFHSLPKGNYYILAEDEGAYSEMFLNSKEYLQSLRSGKSISTETKSGIQKISIDETTLHFVSLYEIKTKFSNLEQLLQWLNSGDSSQYILITHQWSKNPAKNYWWHVNGLSFIEEILEKEECLSEKAIFQDGYAYRKIMFLDKDCYIKGEN